MNQLEHFLKTMSLKKCDRCKRLIWVHFDISPICDTCTKEVYGLDNGMVSGWYYATLEPSIKEYIEAVKEKIDKYMGN